ncbi:MAG TPA: folylpolyglutamate synthase/dihydrofolate synthase family protein [Spirochaetota bacterium]|nr:folylpolyglutamate synthase/dihydrofolate synthase family protein [Spirochaetota bacterium]
MIETRLEKYSNNEKGNSFLNYNLDGITRLLEAAGNPHKSFPCVHIAGTNGKGTTSWILACILRNAGYKTGLYTSPHLVNVNERIRINNIPVADSALITILDKIEEILRSEQINNLTYFDILTSAAFIYFAEQKVDAAVIETGLGGRLDSTNVIDPLISIITDISFDHTGILGDTIEKIAYEKSGIIKPGLPVITSNTVESGLDVIRNVSLKNESGLFILGEEFSISGIKTGRDGITFDYSFNEDILTGLFTPLLPAHQARNCSLALTAALLLNKSGFGSVSHQIITSTLETAEVPGRYERMCRKPEIIYDPAHNISGITNLAAHLEANYTPDKLVMIISLMKDKATPELLEMLSALKFPVIYYQLDDPRAFIPEPGVFSMTADDPCVIIRQISADNSDRSYIFTGTFRNYAIALKVASSLSNIEKSS